MGWFLPAAIIGSTIISTVAGFLGAKKASKAAEKQADEEAKYEKLLTGEALRRLGIEERVQYGELLSGYASGGVLARPAALTQPTTPGAMVGSPQSVLEEQRKEFAFERKITTEAGASRVSQALQAGKATSDAYRYSGYANVASSIANLFASGLGSGWMKKGP